MLNVRSDADISQLKDFISNRRSRNIAWALSWDKLFKISCTPQTWKHTVQHFINSTQLIVVDLSHVGESLKWEIEELRFYGSIDKVITVAHEKNASSARSFLESSGLFECDRKLFIYGDDGRVGRNDKLITALTAIVTLPAAANNSFNPTPR